MIKIAGSITVVKTLGQRLLFARELRGFTQDQLADLAGCTQGAIGNCESGLRTSLRNIVDVARALDTSVYWLWDGKGPAPKANDAFKEAGTVTHVRAAERTPPPYQAALFPHLDERKIRQLSPEDLLRLEGAIELVAVQLGFDIRKEAAA